MPGGAGPGARPVTDAGAAAVGHAWEGDSTTESRLRLLADVSAVLVDAEFDTMLAELADRVVPMVADWCVIDVADESGLRRVAVSHPDPKMRQLAEEIQRRYPPDPEGGGVAEVFRTGQAMIVTEVTDEMLVLAARDSDHLDALRKLGLASVALLPLHTSDGTVGVLTLARRADRMPFDAEERTFLDELSRRAANAVNAARLLREANEAIRLRDDFLAMASHDMRTPLSTILGNVQLARRYLHRSDPEARERLDGFLESAERTTGKLARLVEELMDISMLRTGHPLPIDPAEFDIVELVRSLVDEHQRLATGHEIRLEGAASLIGRWDAMRVERILDNLLENAVKYSPKGGTVCVRVIEQEGAVELVVSDEGIGIPRDEVGTIFERYQRGSNARALRGIGLGLAGSRDVVRQFGGDIAVVSEEGRGSTFTVRLPLGG